MNVDVNSCELIPNHFGVGVKTCKFRYRARSRAEGWGSVNIYSNDDSKVLFISDGVARDAIVMDAGPYSSEFQDYEFEFKVKVLEADNNFDETILIEFRDEIGDTIQKSIDISFE